DAKFGIGNRVRSPRPLRFTAQRLGDFGRLGSRTGLLCSVRLPEISMRRPVVLVALCFGLFGASAGAQPAPANPIAARYQAVADRVMDAALQDSPAWNKLAELADRFGNRLSGSAALEQAIDWVLSEMKRDGLENVRGEPVMVPHWVRGAESAELVEPRAAK